MAEVQSRGELRNNKLQKVAANLFLKHGYDGVTIDRIVETGRRVQEHGLQ